jgi:hypothetical protein
VPIGLVADVPNDAVIRGIEDVVEGDGQFGHPEAASKVPALAGDHFEDEVPDLVRDALKIFLFTDRTEIGGLLDPIEE